MAKIISVSLGKDDLKEIDRLSEEIGFSGRSETIRAGVKKLSEENDVLKKMKGKTTAVLMVLNKHSNKINKIIHKYQDGVKTHLHNHLDSKCLDVFVLKCDAKEIKSLYQEMQKEKTIEQVKISVF